LHRGTPGHMRLPHRLQGQKVNGQGGVGAYCGGDLVAQLVCFCFQNIMLTSLVTDKKHKTEGQTNGQVYNIMPPSASLARWRHKTVKT